MPAARSNKGMSQRKKESVTPHTPMHQPKGSITPIGGSNPENIQDMIVEALEADLNQGEHPLLEPRAARKVLIQGAGRAATSVPRLRRVLHCLVSRPANADTMNALAMILARRGEAPRALTVGLVEKIVDLASN